MFTTGERVLAKRKGDRYWHPGIIAGGGSGDWLVKFDSGEEEPVNECRIMPFALNAGDRVMCRWKGKHAFYPGKVAKIRDGSYFIKFDDGDEEWSESRYLKVHPFTVLKGPGSWWKRLLSPEFMLTQMELVSYQIGRAHV